MAKNSIACLTLTNVITLFNKSIGFIKQHLTHYAFGAATAGAAFAAALGLALHVAEVLLWAALSSVFVRGPSAAFFSAACFFRVWM